MDKRAVSDTECRLLLLSALQALGPVTEAELLRFVSELDLMPWLEMKLSLLGLLDEGQLVKQPHPVASLLRLTPEGSLALETFRHKIPASRRDTIRDAAHVWQARFRGEQDAPAEHGYLRDGRQSIRLRLLQQGSTLLDLLMILPQTPRLQGVEARWRRCAQVVYSSVLATLSEGFTGVVPDGSLPETASLQALQDGEWLLCITDRPQDPTLTLLLSVPDESLARHMAFRWQTVCEALTAQLIGMLSNDE